MKLSSQTTTALLLCALALSSLAMSASSSTGLSSSAENASAAAVSHVTDSENMRVEGERRFHANCGRCHAAPQKFPPRMMGTILRHMRVRATITEEDRRLILLYMTQ